MNKKSNVTPCEKSLIRYWVISSLSIEGILDDIHEESPTEEIEKHLTRFFRSPVYKEYVRKTSQGVIDLYIRSRR